MYFWLTAVALAAVTFSLRRLWLRLSYPRDKIRVPVAPNGWPLIGHAHYFMKLKTPADVLKAFDRLSRNCNEAMSLVSLGPKPWVFVKSPQLIEVLGNHRSAARKDEFFYRGPKIVTGCGVFTREGEAWKVLKKPLLQMALPRNIPDFMEINCRIISETLKQMEKELDRTPFDIAPYTKYLSMKFFLEASLGMKNFDFYPGGLEGIIEEVDKAQYELFETIWNLSFVLDLHAYTGGTIGKTAVRLTTALADERRKILKKRGANNENGEPETYMDLVFKVGEAEGKNDKDTAMIFADLLVAAFDTQSTVMVTTLTFLGIYQDYQRKVYEELVGIFGDSDRLVTEEDVKNMKYLDMCIKESLRWSTAPAVGRYVDADIEIDDYFLPKGTTLVFDWLHASRDPEYWERPNEFYPDHFLPEAASKRPKGSYLPFGMGTRTCPGQSYGMLTMKSFISSVLREYHLASDLKHDDLCFSYHLLRQLENPFIRITRRKCLAK